MKGSLRFRLLAILFATVVIAWFAAAFFSYLDTRRETADLLDRQLVATAELLLETFHREGGSGRFHLVGHGGTMEYRLWHPDGRPLLHTGPEAPAGRLARDAGFSDIRHAGEAWRVYAMADPRRGHWVEVAEPAAIRSTIAEAVAIHLMHTLVVGLPLVALLTWFAVGWGLTPIRALAAQVRRRAPESLQPLDPSTAPREARPLVDALNALFARVTRTLEREQRFAGDAAHELRTPLAAIKTHLEVALASATPAERLEALHSAVRGCDRASRLMEQLLTLARLDAPGEAVEPEPVDVAEIARATVQAATPTAAKREIGLGVTGERAVDARINGHRPLLEVLLRNLVDNALRYSPPGTRVDVEVGRHGDRVVLRVTDQGPGIPATERERILEPFHRILGSGEEGSGLGLSIVARIADLHGATLRLEDPDHGGGLVVHVAFPAAGTGASR